MDESDGPADDVSLKTVLDAVNRQSKNIEAIVEAKVREKEFCCPQISTYTVRQISISSHATS
jgi:hypothetical protein